MYARDQAAIQHWACTEGRLVDVVTMVLLSIRMQWVGVGTQLQNVRKFGAKSPCLWGWKRDGYRYTVANRVSLMRTIDDLRDGEISTRAAMRQFLKVPGLGLAKAGFCLQLLAGRAGCIDMHNLERLSLDAKALTIPKRKDIHAQMQVIDDSIDAYLHLIEECGGTGTLWDEWCEYLADKVSTFDGADDVSRRHYTYLYLTD